MVAIFITMVTRESEAAPVNVKMANCVEYICVSHYKQCIGNLPSHDDFTIFQQESIICQQAKCLCKSNRCGMKKRDKNCFLI